MVVESFFVNSEKSLVGVIKKVSENFDVGFLEKYNWSLCVEKIPREIEKYNNEDDSRGEFAEYLGEVYKWGDIVDILNKFDSNYSFIDLSVFNTKLLKKRDYLLKIRIIKDADFWILRVYDRKVAGELSPVYRHKKGLKPVNKDCRLSMIDS